MLIRLGEIRSELKHIIRNQLQEDVIAISSVFSRNMIRLQVRRIKESSLK